jgi:ectoine hydroxylase-related dioxygenase (phytanoyl-CoA dioxygenase family)
MQREGLPSIEVREVTPDEVRGFAEQGWVLLRGLISHDAAAELRAHGQSLMGESGDQHMAREGLDAAGLESFANYYRPDWDDEVLRKMAVHEQMGRNAAALLQTDNGIRLFSSLLAPKLPKDMETTNPGKGETEIHQDGVRPFRSRTLAFWLALNEVSPEMGSVRFLNGSHRFGGMTAPLDRWRSLDQCQWSDPLHLMPGDATVHCNDVIHRAPENASATTRWAYILAYFVANDTFIGTPTMHTDKLFQAGDLKIGEPLDHPYFPVVYAGKVEELAHA